ncbi:MAG: hypothetical protein HZB31_02280 [Nitrospirae bacterium]|nr:hypothetical protein [Nitrospirota bacterium]
MISDEKVVTREVTEDYALIRKKRQQLFRHRTAAGIVAGLYLLLALLTGSILFVLKLLLFLLLPVAAVWFSDNMGAMTGARFGRLSVPAVTAATAADIVRSAGWIVLFTPVAGFMLKRLLN